MKKKRRNKRKRRKRRNGRMKKRRKKRKWRKKIRMRCKRVYNGTEGKGHTGRGAVEEDASLASMHRKRRRKMRRKYRRTRMVDTGKIG